MALALLKGEGNLPAHEEPKMNQNSAKRTRKLLREAAGLMGMIEEVTLKCKLLKSKARQTCESHGHCWETDTAPDDLSEEVVAKVSKMHRDLDRYSHRLNQIGEELKEINGTISEMDGA